MDKRAPNFVMPAAVGGGILGLLAGIPGLDVLNCCTCCSFAVGGGLLASFLYSRECSKNEVGFRPGVGAGIGALAGVFWGFGAWLISTLASLAFGEVALQWVKPILENNPSIPPEVLDSIDQAMSEGLTVVAVIFDLILLLVVGALFSTVGGLIGGAVFKKEPPVLPAEPVQTPPPPPPPVS